MRSAETHPVAFPATTFRPLAGTTELAIADAASGGGTRPERVTALIAAVYETIGEDEATPALARRLAAGSREWLLQRAALRFTPEVDWFVAPCSTCGEPYDVSLSITGAARQEAHGGFPVAEVETSLGLRRFEAPNGGHEERLARQDGGDPRRTFAAVCGLNEEAESEALRFTERDLDAIDEALEVDLARRRRQHGLGLPELRRRDHGALRADGARLAAGRGSTPRCPFARGCLRLV